MIAFVWTVSLALIVLFGLVTWKMEAVARLDLPARLSIALAAGLVALSVVLFIAAVLRNEWTVLTAGLPLLLLAVTGVVAARRSPPVTRVPWTIGPALAFAAIALLAAYGAAGARMTTADLLYFWGPKATHFADARTINVVFLQFPHYFLMHADYPPLVPLTWAGSSLVAGEFSLWGTLYVSVIVLAATALAFRGFAAPHLGATRSSAFAALLLALLTFGCTTGSALGGADAYLLLFETIAVAALTFGRDRGATAIAALALGGAAFTKVEGAAFVVAVVIALLLVGRFRVAILATLPPAVLLGSWIAFASHHGLLDTYAKNEETLYFQNLGIVLRKMTGQLSYGAGYLPWIAALAPVAVAGSFRRAAFPLLAGGGCVAYSLYFYLHEADPSWLIASSAERVMLTALMCFTVASAAAAAPAAGDATTAS